MKFTLLTYLVFVSGCRLIAPWNYPETVAVQSERSVKVCVDGKCDDVSSKTAQRILSEVSPH